MTSLAHRKSRRPHRNRQASRQCNRPSPLGRPWRRKPVKEQPAAAQVAAVQTTAAQAPATLPADADTQLLSEYVVESLDHIQSAERALLALETNPGGVEDINKVFTRPFHTIKGTSGFLGLSAIQRLSHLAESLLDRARNNKIHIVGGYADLACASCDMLKNMIEALRNVGPEMLAEPANLGELLNLLSNPEKNGIGKDTGKVCLRLGEILVGKGLVSADRIEELAGKQDGTIGKILVAEKAASVVEVAGTAHAAEDQRRRPGRGHRAALWRRAAGYADEHDRRVGHFASTMVAQDRQSPAAGTGLPATWPIRPRSYANFRT